VGPPAPFAPRAPATVVDAAQAAKTVFDRGVVNEQAAEREHVAEDPVASSFANRDGDREELSVVEVVEGEVVGGGFGARTARAYRFLVHELRLGGTGQVEELQDDAIEEGEVTVIICIETDREQMVGIDPVQVRREAGDLELAQNLGTIGLIE